MDGVIEPQPERLDASPSPGSNSEVSAADVPSVVGPPAAPIPVVLLHGLGRGSGSMAGLARRIAAGGHPTLVPGYPSRRRGVRDCAEQMRPAVEAFRRRHAGEVAFVTHSMGGLVARCLAADIVGVRAIVMLAPPNGGSEVADRVVRWRLGRAILGPALTDLTSGRPAALPVPTCAVGIVAGTRAWLPTGRLVAGRNDGLVSLDRTCLAGPHDWIAVAAGHTLLMNHPDVAEAALAFLDTGRFPDRLRVTPDGNARPA